MAKANVRRTLKRPCDLLSASLTSAKSAGLAALRESPLKRAYGQAIQRHHQYSGNTKASSILKQYKGIINTQAIKKHHQYLGNTKRIIINNE